MTQVPFGEWLPDLPDIDNPGALTATNVYPAEGFYRPFRDLEEYSASLSARARGAFTARTITDNTIHLFAGDNNELYKMTGSATSWTKVSAGSYNASGDWSFIQFGGTVLATDGVDAMQKFTLASDASFSAVANSPPIAKYLAVVKDFVVAANISTDNQQVRWAGIDTYDSWTVSAATQADFQTLPGDSGEITGIVGGEFGVIFQEEAIWRQTYVAPPLIFQFDKYELARGTKAPGSIAAQGRTIYFWSEDGFCATDGSQTAPIGQGKVDKTIYGDLDQAFISRMSGTIDARNKCYVCAYPGAGHNANGDPNVLAIYHYPTGRWAKAELEVEILFPFARATGLDADSVDGLFANSDIVPFNVDDAFWRGGALAFAGFTTGHRLGYFNGANLQAILETREAQIFPGRRGFVKSVRPIIDGGTLSVAMGKRDLYTAARSYGSYIAINSIGECPQLANARYHTARVKVDAGSSWAKATGVDFVATPEGVR